jgi:hypothetical protein
MVYERKVADIEAILWCGGMVDGWSGVQAGKT